MTDRKDNEAEARAFVSATIIGMLIVAFRDETLHWSERETLVDAVRFLGDHHTAHETLHLLDDMAHMIDKGPESAWPALFTHACGMSSEMKTLLLGVCTKVAFADGNLSTAESEILHKIADWIGADRSDREVWKREAREALQIAEINGFHYTGAENLR